MNLNVFSGTGWKVRTEPEDHSLSEYEFDVLIGADGKRNTLQGNYSTHGY